MVAHYKINLEGQRGSFILRQGLKTKTVSFKILKRKLNQRINLILELIAEKYTTFNIKVCSQDEIQDLNYRFRGKNTPTDVLSFPFNDMTLLKENIETPWSTLGDLAVCFEVCWRNARRFRKSFGEEVEKMMIHGILHLKGFDHDRSQLAHKIMTGLEESIQKVVKSKLGCPEWIEYKIRESREKRG